MSDKTPTSKTPPTLAPTEVFRAGSYVDAKGQPVTITTADLAATVAAYDAEHSPAPAVIGHPALDAPAYGWIRKLEMRGDTLVAAEFADVDPAFADQISAGRYRKRSLSFHSPTSAANPKPGIWYPKHLGWLGAAAPAVPGLRDVALADGDADQVLTAEFAEPGRPAPWWVLGTIANLLRGLREDAIASRGMEVADRLTPTWMIDSIAEAADYREPEHVPAVLESFPVSNSFAAAPEITPELQAVQAREAAIAARERDLQAREDVAFADGLIVAGELLPAKREATLKLLQSLRSVAEFSAGDGADPRALVRQLAGGGVPSLTPVSDPEPGVLDESVEFAAPPGYAIDPASLQLYARAEQLRRTHPELSLIDAAKRLER
jgi:hypothetical protein